MGVALELLNFSGVPLHAAFFWVAWEGLSWTPPPWSQFLRKLWITASITAGILIVGAVVVKVLSLLARLRESSRRQPPRRPPQTFSRTMPAQDSAGGPIEADDADVRARRRRMSRLRPSPSPSRPPRPSRSRGAARGAGGETRGGRVPCRDGTAAGKEGPRRRRHPRLRRGARRDA